MTVKRYPLPMRFNAAISEKAYERLRDLNQKFHYSNNYILTILLENLDNITDRTALEKVFAEFKKEYGAPTAGKMKSKRSNVES